MISGVVTGSGTTFVTDLTEGQVIRFGMRDNVYFGDAVITGITSATLLTIGRYAGLSGQLLTSTDFSVSELPKSSVLDPIFSEVNGDFDKYIYAVAAEEVSDSAGGQFETGAGWVGVTTYMDTHGNLRVKKEVMVAMSGITTGNISSLSSWLICKCFSLN